MRTRLGLLAAAGLLSLTFSYASPAPTTPVAHAADAGLTFFEGEFKKMGKNVAGKLWSVSNDARKKNLFQFAKEAATRALFFNPNHKDARDYLGYVKKKKEWVLDADAAAKVKPQNTKNAKESQKTFDGKVKKWRESRKKVDAFVAAKYAQLGKACLTKGYGDQAQKAFERALLMDPDQADARKSMGHVKLGKLWLTPKQVEAVNKAIGGEWITEATEYDKGLGVALSKMESPHFRVFDDASKDAIPETIKGLETLYAYFLADVGIDPLTDVFGGEKYDLVVVSTKGPWDKWVDEFSNSADKEWTKGSSTSRSYITRRGGVFRVETAEDVDTRDPLLHHAAHFISQAVWKSRPVAWLDEGLAYYYTVRVQNTTRTSCLAKETIGEYGNDQEVVGGDKDWTVSEQWREFLHAMVKAKADTELRTIMLTPLSTLKLHDSVKAWAVVTFLMEKYRDPFITFLKRIRDEPKVDQEKAVEEIFGKGIEDLDKEWRAFAIRAF